MKLFAAIIGGAWVVAFAVTLCTLVGTPTNSPAASFSDFVACESIATVFIVAGFMVLYARWLRRRFIAGRTPRAPGISWRHWVLGSVIALCPMVVAYFALGAYGARDPSFWAQVSAVTGVVSNLAMSFNLLLMIQRLRAFDPRTELCGGVGMSRVDLETSGRS